MNSPPALMECFPFCTLRSSYAWKLVNQKFVVARPLFPPVNVVRPGTVRTGASRPGRIPKLGSDAAGLLPADVAKACAVTRFIPIRNTLTTSELNRWVALMDAVFRHK